MKIRKNSKELINNSNLSIQDSDNKFNEETNSEIFESSEDKKIKEPLLGIEKDGIFLKIYI